MVCPDCRRMAAELEQIRRHWAATRRRYVALHQAHETLLAAWQNECAINDRLRVELRQLKGDTQ